MSMVVIPKGTVVRVEGYNGAFVARSTYRARVWRVDHGTDGFPSRVTWLGTGNAFHTADLADVRLTGENK